MVFGSLPASITGGHVTRIDRTGRARFALEPLDEPRIVADRDLFDRDAPAGRGVDRFVHDAHAAATELAQHFVLAGDHARRAVR